MARALRWTGIGLIVFGFTVLEFVAYELIGTSWQTNARQAALERELSTRFSAQALGGAGNVPPVTVLPSPNADDVTAWARIQIPKIGITKVLVEGATVDALVNGPGHYVGTPLPGVPGSVGIAGHRTTWGAPFYNLDRLEPGDLVIVQSAQGRYRYKVTGAGVFSPRETSPLLGDPNSTAEHRLTLTTCEPRYSAAKRLVVWADLVSWRAAS